VGLKKISHLLILSFLFMGFSSLYAETPEEKGLRLAKEFEAANNGFIGESGKTELILIDAHGEKVVRIMKGKSKEVIGDGDKSISIFENPKDVKGTKMLTWSHKNKDDQQWLFLPSVRRVKKISSKNKSASFMGSEFSYEDLGSQEVEKYKFKWLKDTKFTGLDCYVIERTPTYKSGYSKQISYIAKKYSNPLKVEYYDRKNQLLKVALFEGYEKHTVGGKSMYRPKSIKMDNVQTKKKSIFSWKNRKIGVSFSDNEFRKNNLKR
jgi:outer membrane lipoprotein-sorting protein